MSSSTSKFQNPAEIQPQHRSHSADEPLPSKAPFDYSPESMQKVKLPPSEEGESQFEMNKGSRSHPIHSNCDCEGRKSGIHEGHCMSALHRKDKFVNEPVGSVKAPEGHHFFADGRPGPVSQEERETVEASTIIA